MPTHAQTDSSATGGNQQTVVQEQQSDSTLTITVEQLERWAAKRAVADDMLKDTSKELGVMRMAMRELMDANGECIDAAREEKGTSEQLRAALRLAQDERNAAQQKLQRQRPWARVGKVVVWTGVAVGGFFAGRAITQALEP
jgi:hypothetical protein